MFSRFFGHKPEEDPKKDQQASQEQARQEQAKQEQAKPAKPVKPEEEEEKGHPGQRFNFLHRTRQVFERMSETVEEVDNIDENLWDDLEEQLLAADVGPRTSELLIEHLRKRATQENMRSGKQVQRALREELASYLGKPSPLRFSKQSPISVILVIGVNGSGKTTSVAKMAHLLTKQGHNVLLAAADTFRAAAIDQLKVWGERINVPVISQNPGSDPGAVVFDALQAAQNRGCDVVIVDTAGRLHTKYNLMEELKKINKVVQRFVPDGPHELLIVIDATTGQNALLQARKFAEDIGLTGVVVTKLDSTAKGGFAFAVVDDLDVPIKFIGTGEKIGDIAPFDPQSFVAALFAHD